jgi:hypothetical protein
MCAARERLERGAHGVEVPPPEERRRLELPPRLAHELGVAAPRHLGAHCREHSSRVTGDQLR